MTLETLGWDAEWERAMAPLRPKGLEVGRVGVEDKHHFLIYAAEGVLLARPSGKMLREAGSGADLPKVGDWAAWSPKAGEAGKAVIHEILPRRTRLSRKVPGREMEEQVLAANVDVVFLMQALDDSFDARIVERQMVMVHNSGARPVVVLNKADLRGMQKRALAEVKHSAGDAPVLVISAKTGRGIDPVRALIHKGETVVFIGPSGVGKSTLINRLYGEEIQGTTEVRECDSEGRHTTTWRELIVLPQGGVVIDTPGMREFQLWLAGQGIYGAFPDIESLSTGCRFRDCTHTREPQCAVHAAVADGRLAQKRFDSFQKLRSELVYLEKARHRQSWSDRKRRDSFTRRSYTKTRR